MPGRGRLYAQLFDRSLSALSEPEAIEAESLPGLVTANEPGAPVVVVGTGQGAALAALAPAIDARPAPGPPTPDARVLVRRVAACVVAGGGDTAVRPLYLREAGAKRRARPHAGRPPDARAG